MEQDDSDFSISFDEALEQIGQPGIDQLLELQKWLYQRNGFVLEPIRFRMAPSLVIRSESELWATSNPRFSLRAYLGNYSFVNARRLEIFQDVLRKRGRQFVRRRTGANWENYKFQSEAYEEVHWSFDQLLKQCPLNCIGDSLLAPPDEYLRKYYSLTVDLGPAYGEQRHIYGTPFLKHINLGGGMCSQASCLMANALLHDYIPDRQKFPEAGIHGVSEVTAIAQGETFNELFLHGLRWHEIVHYFAMVGRSAVAQNVSTRLGFLDPDVSFGRSMSGYLCSGLPIILPVNFASMNVAPENFGKSVYEENWPQGYEDWKEYHRQEQESENAKARECGESPRNVFEKADHAVVVVGAERPWEASAQGLTFLINDPARLPFVKATDWQLYYCAGHEIISGNPPRSYHAVTPAEVEMTLQSHLDQHCVPDGAKIEYMGMFDVAFHLQRSWTEWTPDWPHLKFKTSYYGNLLHSKYDPGNWELRRSFQLKNLNCAPASMQDALNAATAEMARYGNHWFWIQYVDGKSCDLSESLWIWDAQKSLNLAPREEQRVTPDDRRQMGELLLAVYTKRDGQWVRICRQTTDAAEARLKAVEKAPPQTPRYRMKSKNIAQALISSCCTQGIKKITWPAGIGYDLYAFMHNDEVLQIANSATAAHRMAEIVRKNEVGALKQRVAKALAGQNIVALSTFIPELTSSDPDQAEIGHDAVRCLIALARELKVPVIELVSGSRIEGICTVKRIKAAPGTHPRMIGDDRPEPCFFANRMSRDEALERLEQSLHRVVQAAGLRPGSGPTLAVELEPGPLYILNNLQSLRDVVACFKKPAISGVTGFSLDVAHWALAGIDPRKLIAEDPDIVDHIVHVHISDHGLGHFGDVALVDVGLGRNGIPADNETFAECNLAAFSPWMMLIDHLAMNRPRSTANSLGLPPFSGCISVELEAAVGMSAVYRSLKGLGALLQ